MFRSNIISDIRDAVYPPELIKIDGGGVDEFRCILECDQLQLIHAHKCMTITNFCFTVLSVRFRGSQLADIV